MIEKIDNGLINAFDKAIEEYVNDDIGIGISKSAIISLLYNYSLKLHDINFLIENERFESVNILMRVAFENETYIKYIFSRPSRFENRGKAYFYSKFQKVSYYLKYGNNTNILRTDELIKSINNSDYLGNHSCINEYFNYFRNKYKACFKFNDSDNTKGLKYDLLNNNDNFKAFNIDKWNWYNDDNKTNNFMKLIIKLGMNDDYMSLYAPTSDSIHSDGLTENLVLKKNSFSIVQKFNPSMLVFFKWSIFDNINFILKYTKNDKQKAKIKKILKEAENIYRLNG